MSRPHHSRRSTLLAIALLTAATFSLLPPTPASAADITSEVHQIWEEMKSAAPAQAHCATTPPRVVWDPSIRTGFYKTTTATITLGTHRRDVIAHELAHHLDYSCGGAAALGEALRASQGLPSDRPWTGSGKPAGRPAEYFANAVILAIGYPSKHNVKKGTVEVVRAWMTGSTPPPSTTASPLPSLPAATAATAPQATTTTLPPATTTVAPPPPPEFEPEPSPQLLAVRSALADFGACLTAPASRPPFARLHSCIDDLHSFSEVPPTPTLAPAPLLRVK